MNVWCWGSISATQPEFCDYDIPTALTQSSPLPPPPTICIILPDSATTASYHPPEDCSMTTPLKLTTHLAGEI